MDHLTENEFRALPIGTRIIFPEGAESYPNFRFNEKLTGTLIHMDECMAWVRLDQHKEELAEWDNDIQVSFDDCDINEGRLPHEMTLQPLDANDGSLDLFVQTYCKEHGIRIDGDVFGMMFSEVNRVWTAHEAAKIVEQACEIYGLRNPQEWTIETTEDREGNTLYDAAVSEQGQIIWQDVFYSRETALAEIESRFPDANEA